MLAIEATLKFFRTTAFALILTCFRQLCPATTPRLAATDGTSADWTTGKSRQEARVIEDQRYKDVIAGLDKMHRSIYADYSADRIACGNDYRTNAGCLKAAADKRDRRLAANDQLRAQANALHANQIEDIYRSSEKAGAPNQSSGDIIASRGGGNPCAEGSSQQVAPDGTRADSKTGPSRQQALTIEDQRYGDEIAGLDKAHRNIYADYSTDRIACGNDYRSNASCLKAAADKRDRRLAENDQLRAQANASHANRIQDIYRNWEKLVAPNQSTGDIIASRGGGNPCNDTISSGGGGNPSDAPVGGNQSGNGGGRANPNGNRGGGNTSENQRTPVSDRPQPPLDGNVQAECRQIPDSVWPPLAQFQKFMNEVVAGYDVTRRPDAGLRIMQDSLMGLGFGWLVKAAPPLLAAAADRVAVRIPFPVWRWGTPRVAGAVTVTLMSAKLPPGMSLPAILKSTPRPLYLQEKESSCGLACVKMMVETVKRTSLPESWYRSLARGAFGPFDPCAYTPGQGAAIPRLADVLRQAGVTNSFKSGQRIEDLFAATRDGYPALVAVGDAKAGHAVIVDGFARDAAGNWFVLARDPWNLNLLDANARWSFEQLGFQNYAVYSLPDFTGPGGWSGLAIYTAP